MLDYIQPRIVAGIEGEWAVVKKVTAFHSRKNKGEFVEIKYEKANILQAGRNYMLFTIKHGKEK